MSPEHHTTEGEVPIGETLETEEAGEEGELEVGLQMVHLQETNIFSYATAVTPKDTEQKSAQQKQNWTAGIARVMKEKVTRTVGQADAH